MAARSLLSSPAMVRQNLLAEFAGLKTASLSGIYLCIDPGDACLWNGVLFVRKGPYASAVLRFNITFPARYPQVPPIIVFTTEIFHPLITPLTAQESHTSTIAIHQWLPPGGFSLRHGFPSWFNAELTSSVASVQQKLSCTTVYSILNYLRTTFDDPEVIDEISPETAANPGALQAWQSYRHRLPAPSHAKPQDSSTAAVTVDEWNWDGVWESRTGRGIENSLSEQVLYGGVNGDDNIIQFSPQDGEKNRHILYT